MPIIQIVKNRNSYSITTTKVRRIGAQSKTNLECEVALRTHICERGVVPKDQLYSIIAVAGTLTGTP